MFKLNRILLNSASSLPRDAFGRVPNNFYQVLKVSRKASLKEIKTAFVGLAKQYHPDNKNGGDQELFRQLNEAYKVLSDPAKRLEYDFEMQQDEEAFRLEEQFKQDEAYSKLFGNKRQQRVRTVNLSEEDRQRFMEMMKKKKTMENFDGNMKRNHNHMFVDLKKQKKSPWKLVLMLLGGITLLWSVKLTMWYNSVYKNWKGTDEIIDVVHPFANDAESNVQRSIDVPHKIKNMLIQYQDKRYIDVKYYKQSLANNSTLPNSPSSSGVSTPTEQSK